MVDGFLVVDKPAGITSHDVVARVRRTFGIKRVGHTGTLDPFATGVLPVAIGNGTKAIPFLDESVKEYQAVMRLGTATDTQDVTGQAVFSGDFRHVTQEQIQTVFTRFTGTISQIPPMFSAVKQDGVPLYRLARKGETVERKERQAIIHSITVNSFELPDIDFTVRCSRGTYIRTLADDVGRELGCGAHLISLRRTVSGLFSLAEAVPCSALTAAADPASLLAKVLSPVAALRHLRSQQLTAEDCSRVRHGMLPLNAGLSPEGAAREQLLLLCREQLVAVAEASAGSCSNVPIIRLLRVFSQECPLHSGK